MDKKSLDSILKSAYSLPLWRQVLTDVFGVRNLNQTPQTRMLPTIIIKGLTLLDACIDEKGNTIPGKSTLVVTSNNLQKLKVSLCLFNSKLWFFYISEKYSASSYNQGITFAKDMFNNFPLPEISNSIITNFENLVDYILFLKELGDAEQVSSSEFTLQRVAADETRWQTETRTQNEEHAEAWTQNAVAQFEEVIDALVYELYFEADFRAAQIEFLRYAARDFPALENKSREQKKQIIRKTYQRLRQKDNEIRNNLKLMDIRLGELIMPIKTAR